ncbi:MAG: glutaredoxin [Oscillospiraceae bacterium]|nr:glutaredoxin [Oscillospiraceae bacterium]
MFIVYGSDMCPDCVACKLNFDAYGIEYRFIDINARLKDLSDFLVLRDSDPVFDRCKSIHDIGLPAIVREDGSVFLSWEKYIEELGHTVLIPDTAGAACGTDGKGC